MTFTQIMVLLALVWMVVTLIFTKLPNAVIAMGIVLIVMLSGVNETPIKAMANLISPTTLLIACIMILLSGMFKSGFAELMGKMVLKLTGGRTNETAIFIVIIAVSTVMTWFLPNGGTASVLIPVCIAVSMISGVSRSRTLWVMNTAVGLGGCMTSLGTVINTYCGGLIQDNGWATVGFFGFLPCALPAYVFGILFMLTIGRRLVPNWVKEEPQKNESKLEEAELSPEERRVKNRKMAIVGVSFGICVFGVCAESVTGIQGWIFGFVGVILMLATKSITEKEAFDINWGILLFVFACSCLADAFKACGIASLVVGPLTALLGSNPSPLVLTAVMFIVGAFFTQFMSNFGTFGVFSSICITLATAIGANPAAMLMALAMGCNASYATPMATTCNMFILGEGDYKFVDYLKNGIPQVVITGICTIVFLPIFYPFY